MKAKPRIYDRIKQYEDPKKITNSRNDSAIGLGVDIQKSLAYLGYDPHYAFGIRSLDIFSLRYSGDHPRLKICYTQQLNFLFDF